MDKEIIKTGDFEGLKKALNNYQYGVAGGYIEDQLDKACDTIVAIKDFLNGADIEIEKNNYPPFRINSIDSINKK